MGQWKVEGGRWKVERRRDGETEKQRNRETEKKILLLVSCFFASFLLPFYLSTFLPLFTGCVPKAKYLIENYSPPEKIAVLPFTNQSVDFDAPAVLRSLFTNRLMERGYITIPFEEIDAKLLEMGITDAGQLPTATPKEISEKLNVDGLIYGDVMEFKYTTLGFYFARTVQANFKLFKVDANSETPLLLWEDERKASTKRFETKNIGRAFAEQLIEKTVDKALKSPLREEANRVVDIAIYTLPRRDR